MWEGDAPAEPPSVSEAWLGRSLALPCSHQPERRVHVG